MNLRDVFGDEVADKVLNLPVPDAVPRLRLPDELLWSYDNPVAHVPLRSEAFTCACIVGACLRVAHGKAYVGNLFAAQRDPYRLGIQRQPGADQAIEKAETILSRELSHVERVAIRDAIARWDSLHTKNLEKGKRFYRQHKKFPTFEQEQAMAKRTIRRELREQLGATTQDA